MFDSVSIINNIVSNFIYALIVFLCTSAYYFYLKRVNNESVKDFDGKRGIKLKVPSEPLLNKYSSVSFTLSDIERSRLNSFTSSFVKTQDPLVFEGNRTVTIIDHIKNETKQLEINRLEIKAKLPGDRYFSLNIDKKQYFDLYPRFSFVELNKLDKYLIFENNKQLFPLKIKIIWYYESKDFSLSVNFDSVNLFSIEDCIKANEFLLAFYQGNIFELKEKNNSFSIPLNLQEGRKLNEELFENNKKFIEENLESFEIIRNLKNNFLSNLHAFRPSLNENDIFYSKRLENYFLNNGIKHRKFQFNVYIDRKNILMFIKEYFFKIYIGDVNLIFKEEINQIPFLSGKIHLENQSIFSSKNSINNRFSLLISILLFFPFMKQFKIEIVSNVNSIILEKYDKIKFVVND
ncbi:hypothetical protein [Leptospira sp. GIMC2001]|uniref:hypothetical protein n=1 Tax=Leptospira sp. GIMC2001 TaxID=1513297 RepID=UPI00234B9CAA|nr:hypothetical protein [Leptospira sp. GIMC2001]WCL50789.1 hypothetical protein O4O04_08245 [Leptospira sp. GIMC2001]